MNTPVFFRTGSLPTPRLLFLVLTALGICSLGSAVAAEVENPQEVAGFFGQVTGTVKSVQPNDPSFVLAVTKAEPDPATSTLKDGAPLVGKQLTFGVRMPKPTR